MLEIKLMISYCGGIPKKVFYGDQYNNLLILQE